LTEPDVTLTDFALALQSAYLGFALWRDSPSSSALKSWLMLYFGSVAVASLCGGLVHGFFLEQGSPGQAILWPATLLAIGASALATGAMGSVLLFSPQVTRVTTRLMLFAVAIYCVAVLSGVHKFRIAIAITLPAALLLLAALVIVYVRDRRPGAVLAAIGIIMTLAAAFGQQLGLRAHPLYFNHNATAHVVQAIALGFFFIGGTRLCKQIDKSVVVGGNDAISARIP
jgi:hypothetical protein